ncbi:MAG: hypothetical protein MK226_16080 [Saprospiraceae bacterium]|nr:hypothetical protein [Saprospiraceae bacterium]
MKNISNLFLLLLSIALLWSCDAPNVEGIWQQEQANTAKAVLLKIDEGYSFREKGSRRWKTFKKIAKDKFATNGNLLLSVLDENKLEVKSLENKNQRAIYIKTQKDKPIELWAVNSGMKRELVTAFFEKPDTIVKEGLVEKWYYPENIAVIFDENGVIKTHKNYYLNKDLSKIQLGMDRKEVVKLVGNPDRKTKRSYSPDYQVWYYGKNQGLIFGSEGVSRVVLDIEESSERFRSLFLEAE